MPAHKRTPLQIERDHSVIARRYLRGEFQGDIARDLGISQQQVSYDLKKIQAAWHASALRDFDARKAEELARLDELEREYWAAWERSKLPLEHTHTEQSEDEITLRAGRTGRVPAHRTRKKASRRTEEQNGNSAFLYGVERCIAERCKILGLYAPTDVNLAGTISFGDLFTMAQQGDPPPLQLLPQPGDTG